MPWPSSQSWTSLSYESYRLYLNLHSLLLHFSDSFWSRLYFCHLSSCIRRWTARELVDMGIPATFSFLAIDVPGPLFKICMLLASRFFPFLWKVRLLLGFVILKAWLTASHFWEFVPCLVLWSAPGLVWMRRAFNNQISWAPFIYLNMAACLWRYVWEAICKTVGVQKWIDLTKVIILIIFSGYFNVTSWKLPTEYVSACLQLTYFKYQNGHFFNKLPFFHKLTFVTVCNVKYSLYLCKYFQNIVWEWDIYAKQISLFSLCTAFSTHGTTKHMVLVVTGMIPTLLNI